MKNTPFTIFHREMGAKISPFAGYYMPIKYKGINEEHIAVRNGVGVFDVSHMGEFWIRGEKALDLVQKITSNDASKLKVGKVQYSCFPNEKGGIVDDLLVYHYGNNEYLLVVNASNIEKDWSWVKQQNTMNAEIENASDNVAQLAIQGPKTIAALQSLTDINLEEISYYTFKVGKFASVDNVIISATGYTGAGGFELYFDPKYGEEIWKAIFKAGEKENIKAIGLAARDTLRLEMGFCLYGNDINDETSPIEAGLSWITKFTDNKNFINKEALLSQKKNGVEKRLKAFEMIDRGIPRQHYKILDVNGNEIGEVTSGTMSPMLKKGIGMGYIKKGNWKVGTEIFIKVRKKQLKAKIVKLPFYKKN